MRVKSGARLPIGQKVDVNDIMEDNDYLRTRVYKLEQQVASYQKKAKGLPGYLRCSLCRVPKPTSEFWRDRSTKWGYRSQCKDCANPGRKIITHCPQGHPYDETNTRTDKHGWRHCRECRRTQKRVDSGL